MDFVEFVPKGRDIKVVVSFFPEGKDVYCGFPGDFLVWREGRRFP
ncbi:MAG TPA: hypothetical protein PLA96_11130 [Candidatus Brocadia sapporoensis]|mgnify:CR=1 FL=1|nr:hypothetical protein [Candidatus Brocadia sapporoensis]HQU32033.1 hypothetical protein [Candidatus Brocadia sapporoensis]